jgi:transposase
MKEMLKFIFIGVDLHKRHHTAVIMNFFNEKLGEVKFINTPATFPELLAEVKKHVKKGMTPVYGLEDTGGYGRSLAVFLKEKRLIVKEVNPAMASEHRKKRASVEKNDSWDAECVARVLKDEYNRLPDANPIDIYWAIGQLVTTRQGLSKDYMSHVRRLHQHLGYAYPSYMKFFSEVDGKTALAFWEAYPAQHHLVNVTVDELALLLRKHSNNGLSTKKAESILTLIAKDGIKPLQFQSSHDTNMRCTVATIKFHQHQIQSLDFELQELVKPLNIKLESMTGISHVTAAYLIAEIGNIHRFVSADKLAKYAGIAPKLVGSGDNHRHRKSKQGDRDLHELFEQLAVRQIGVNRTKKDPRNPYFYNYYQNRLAAGKTKKQAIICIMRKLVNIIYCMMKDGTEYVIPALPEKVAG